MVVGKSTAVGGSLTPSCHCFKVANLKGAILDVNQISDLKDRYILGEQLGWGQFGVIWACADKFTGEVLACKSISKDRLITQDNVRSVRLEIEIMTRLSGHPNVVDLKAVYEEEDYVHLVMELCSGGELFHQLEKHGRYSESQAKILFRHLMQVVLYCHDKGVVHRDLKPENILLADKTTSSPIKLADFGLATYIKPGQNLHGTVGSPFYIAPEVLSGGYTQAADVWSAGVILYILLSGVPPFWGKTKSRIFDAVRAADLCFPREPWCSISESATKLIRKMLSIDPLIRLTAEQVLAHPWMAEAASSSPEDLPQQGVYCSGHLEVREREDSRTAHPWMAEAASSSPEDLPQPGVYCSGHLEVREHEDSFSFSFMNRDTDISCGLGSDVTSKSSFTAFLVEASAPASISGGFSFCSSSISAVVELASPIPSMPSFKFCSPSLGPEETSHVAGSSPDSSPSSRNGPRNPDEEFNESKRTTTGLSSTVIHNKRNQTIGVGEFGQLDLDAVVTESVIRWASCTHLPAASSLRTSLVC